MIGRTKEKEVLLGCASALLALATIDAAAQAENSWAEVAEAGASATSKAAFTSGVVRGESAAPVSVSTNAAGHVVFDFGQHVFGWIEVNVEKPGAWGAFDF